MGNRHSYCFVHENAPSPLYYELRSVTTEPLAGVVDFQTLFWGIGMYIKCGGLRHGMPGLKDERCLGDAPGMMVLQRTFDTTAFSFPGYSAEEAVTLHVFGFLPDKNLIVEKILAVPSEMVLATSTIIIHPPRLRVECWRQNMSLERMSGVEPTMTLQAMLAAALGDHAVTCRPDQDSLITPGRGINSVLSEDMSKRTNFDELWDGMLQALRTQEHNPHKKFLEVKQDGVNDEGVHELEVMTLIDAEYLMEAGYPVPQAADRMLSYKVKANKKTGVITSEFFDDELLLLHQADYFVVHREPLVVEYWAHKSGERIIGPEMKALVERTLNTIIRAKKESKSREQFVMLMLAMARSGDPAMRLPKTWEEATGGFSLDDIKKMEAAAAAAAAAAAGATGEAAAASAGGEAEAAKAS